MAGHWEMLSDREAASNLRPDQEVGQRPDRKVGLEDDGPPGKSDLKVGLGNDKALQVILEPNSTDLRT